MLSPPMPASSADGLGLWIRQWRHNHRWTQEHLAEELGYEVSYVAKIERGRRRPSAQFVARLAAVVDVAQHELLQLSRRPNARLRLPLPTTQVVGRDREIADVTALLGGSSRCVTLIGAPGIGKTSLALEVAWRRAEDFRHGACFVALADVASPSSVTSAVVHDLGLREQGAVDIEDLLSHALRDQQLLLVLDNFEHVLDARLSVLRLVDGCPNVRILVTSREALGLECETRYTVRALDFPSPSAALPDDVHEYPAVKVFVTKSRQVRDTFVIDDTNAGSVVEICARLDGLPLAIALTANASRILSPADIARSLRARLELPTEGADDPLSHCRLRSALDWSWDLLPPGQRALLARLAVFSGGGTLAAVEEICGDGDGDVLTALAALERKSLVEASQASDGESRFSCLEPIRRYAFERLQEQGSVDDVCARHCAYFVTYAETGEAEITAGVEQGRWARRLETDHANLAAALEWSLENDPERALRLGAALGRYFSMHRVSEGRHWLGTALERAPRDAPLRAKGLIAFAMLTRLHGDLDLAEASIEEARALAVERGAKADLALATLTSGIVAEDRALYDVAHGRFVEATDLYREIGQERGLGHGLNCLGMVALRRGEIATASEHFHAALHRFRRLDDGWSVAVAATNLGWIAETSGELAEARDWYEETRQMWERSGDEHGRARSLASLGRVARHRRDFAQARRLLEDALHVFHRLGHRRLAAACLVELADVAHERKRCDLAARLLGAAQSLRASLGTPAWADETALEDHVLAAITEAMGAASANRIYVMGQALTLEDAVDMVRSDGWPPSDRRARGGPARSAASARSAAELAGR